LGQRGRHGAGDRVVDDVTGLGTRVGDLLIQGQRRVFRVDVYVLVPVVEYSVTIGINSHRQVNQERLTGNHTLRCVGLGDQVHAQGKVLELEDTVLISNTVHTGGAVKLGGGCLRCHLARGIPTCALGEIDIDTVNLEGHTLERISICRNGLLALGADVLGAGLSTSLLVDGQVRGEVGVG